MLKKIYPLIAIVLWSCNDAPKQVVERIEEDAQTLKPALLSLDSLKQLPNANHFYFIGNWGRHGQEQQQNIADKMGEAADILKPSGIFTLGDNFKPRGVNSTQDPTWNTSFESVYTHHLLHCPWYIALGDQDYIGSVNALMNYQQISARWVMPAKFYQKTIPLKDSASLSAYIFDTPSMERKMADQELGSAIYFRDSIFQSYWYKNTMSKDVGTWKIGVGHHDVISASKTWRTPGTTASNIGKWMEEGLALDFYFSAEEEQVQVLAHDSVSTTFVVVGSGSMTDTSAINLNKNLKYSKATPAFAILSLNKQKALLQIISAEGAVLYSKTINK